MIGKFIQFFYTPFRDVCVPQIHDISIKIRDVDIKARESSARNDDQPLRTP